VVSLFGPNSLVSSAFLPLVGATSVAMLLGPFAAL